MKRGWLLGIGALVLILIFWFASTGNQMVSLDEAVNQSKSQVENVYQRRMDLIPNLVATVKGYAKHEADVLEEVTKARAQASGQVNLSSADAVKQFEQSQAQLTGALSRLMVVVEKYPDLKADKNFRDLQSQLEGTENRITIERQRFNETCQAYNTYIRSFPQSMVASFRGFTAKPYFAAQAGANQAPKVEF